MAKHTHTHTQSFALYNEIDPYAAEWLENLIARGLVAPGVVDRRSIEDLRGDDLRGFRQVHLFAGIGVWSYALRRAGISDDTALWTGSCPCQPFSAAGKGGGMADERHLWPAFLHLVRECRPSKIYGEQVASKDGLGWLDTLQADLEGSDYACGAVDTCSAGFGAPHIRQRLRFAAYDLRSAACRLADTNSGGVQSGFALCKSDDGVHGRCIVGLDNNNKGLEGLRSRYRSAFGYRERPVRSASSSDEFGGMADNEIFGRNIRPGFRDSRSRGLGRNVSADNSSALNAADTDILYADGWGDSGIGHNSRDVGQQLDADGCDDGPGPTNGFWRYADWLFCRDGKWRPVGPGTFPLAHGASSRVGRLRAYGNAVDAEATREFIEASLERETINITRSVSFDDLI